MSAKVNSIGLKGLEGYLVQVQVHVMSGVESVVIVGLPDASVKESRERVSAALHSMDYSLADKKVVVNLSPAEQKKNGPLFDLAIALGILKSGEFLDARIPEEAAFIGALSLDGTILPVQGMLPAVLAAKRLGLKRLFLPFDATLPSIDIEGVELVYVSSLEDVVNHLNGKPTLPAFENPQVERAEEKKHERDFQQIIGQAFAKRALEIAAAGGHHVMLEGPPGCGKSLLAETFPSILPFLSKEEQLEKISLYQLAGAPLESLTQPPFRHPHHSASSVSIIGGGSTPKPGEVSLAHQGVLFLDELAEFSKKTLDMLRQPLENRKVTISRAHSTVTYPAQFLFLAAMNPCPCGYKGSRSHYCTCSENQTKAYQNRVSGPIRDRIDILLALTPIKLTHPNFQVNETSEMIRQRVISARERQYERYSQTITNGDVSYEKLVETSPLTPQQLQLLQEICLKQGFSNRVQIKIIRLARTISDLAGEEGITDSAIMEACTLRQAELAELRSIGVARVGEHYG